MVLTEHDRTNFRSSNVCHICEKPLNSDKVRDHCHVTGKYNGASHYKCNIQRSYKHYDIPRHTTLATIFPITKVKVDYCQKRKPVCRLSVC